MMIWDPFNDTVAGRRKLKTLSRQSNGDKYLRIKVTHGRAVSVSCTGKVFTLCLRVLSIAEVCTVYLKTDVGS
ncbi:unnamed protein product [Allacma fusca]|uniref:Uncharacterized protein n=1 Tax=Allacma fusca TaxID=39272 RepID=A0A8J2PN77_9HEXA|nr:unnamed protein product [Allacma fusca]